MDAAAVEQTSALPKSRFASSALAVYAASVLLSIVVLIFSLQLWNADLHIPFGYVKDGHDNFLSMMLVKTEIETGWTWHNPLLGAPGTLDQLDFPNPQFLQDAAIRALAIFSHDFGFVLNIYFLLTFPLVALTATLAARQIGLGAATSILVAQLYTFLPYHFLRGEMHLSLSAYYAIPLIIPCILAIALQQVPACSIRATALVGFILLGLSGPYYTAFAAFFLFVATICAAFQHYDRKLIKLALVFAGLMFLAFFLQTIPNLVHSAHFGANPSIGNREYREGDLYGLRLTQMLLPVPGHRIPALAQFRDLYASHAYLVNENEDAALGFIGSFGLIILLLRAVFRRPPDQSPSKISSAAFDALAALALAGLLFATIGGVGPTLNYLGFTAIRGYNRISIFLAFFALIGVGGIIERLATRRRYKSQFILIAAGLLLILGLLDQISPRVVPDYQQNAKDFRSDAAFVAAIESAVPAGASIFQMPIMFYPESTPINGLGDYELFRGYLHSSTLHWSYGAVGGRDAFAWQRQTIKLPLPQLLAQLQARHFSGIYLDRAAYLDDSLERSLGSLLGQAMVSRDGRLVFFKFAVGEARQ
jgi:hypothetical protein